MAIFGSRSVSRSTTGANQNNELQAALASSSASVSSGVSDPGCAIARSLARTVRVKGLKLILPTETSRPSILETSSVRTERSTLGTCQAATPHSSSATATMDKRILPTRRVNLNFGIRMGIASLLVRQIVGTGRASGTCFAGDYRAPHGSSIIGRISGPTGPCRSAAAAIFNH